MAWNRCKSVVMIARLLRSQNFRWPDFHVLALVLCAWFSWLVQPALAQNIRLFEDNADSIAVVIGNKNYSQTVSVDFGHNDAAAMRDFLSRSLGFRVSNILVLKDATLSQLNQMFGSERRPQDGRLWRAVKEGRSNVFVYYSGHGVPDLQTHQPFLLPSDGDPSQAETGFLLDTLYQNLALVKGKVGADRQVIVMIDACFTGETGRKGESLLTVSAPGFVPARPKAGSGIVKLLATSARSPANWDQDDKLGLFTSRFLLGAAGLARVADPTPDLSWADLRRFVIDSVKEGARREMGREQVPEIDEAALTLKPDGPVPAIERTYGRMRDEASWRAAEAANTVPALENYIARCGAICAFKDRALDALVARRGAAAAAADAANWETLSALEKYQDYLEGCGRVCAYREIARRYLALAPPVAPTRQPAAPAVVPGPPTAAGDASAVGARPMAAPAPARPTTPQQTAVFSPPVTLVMPGSGSTAKPEVPRKSYGDEDVDFNIPEIKSLSRIVGGPTPLTIPGITKVTTVELMEAIQAGHPMVLIDVVGQKHTTTIKGAIPLPYAGASGSFRDQVQTRLTDVLNGLLQGRAEATLVFFCGGAKCWESYNAALRARAAGFKNILWYRGGLEAWEHAGFPMQPT